MTRLRTVRLYLYPDDYAQAIRNEFLFRSCYVSNFLTRSVRRIRFVTEGIKGVLLQGRRAPDVDPWINVDSNLIVPVEFAQERYELMRPGEQHEFFLEMFVEGLDKAARCQEIPLAELMAAIDEFRKGGYANEWVHQRKVLRPIGLQASLVCRIDTTKFTLNLALERKGTKVFDETILETKPDELIFVHRFKKVALEEQAIVVKDKHGKVIYSLDAKALV